MKNNRTNLLLVLALIVFAVISRIISNEMQWFNLAPVTAVGLFAGAVVKDKRYAFLFAILGQLGGDLYFQFFTNTPGFYGVDQAFVYISLLAVTALGFLMNQPKAMKVLGFSFAAAVLFFIVSNFGVWVAIQTGKADMFGYGTGITGLMNTYIAALPFFKNTLIATVGGSILLFGAYHVLQTGFGSRLESAKA
ncbi:MAG TPA: DUF6580 family putative transport protein [Flavipsychrobacter sp.]|nr:DUF6580 family putative transport protein [Flavipsychrobacter sp.]